MEELVVVDIQPDETFVLVLKKIIFIGRFQKNLINFHLF
jgi:hypothetical protein